MSEKLKGIKDVQIRLDGEEIKVTWLMDDGTESPMVIPYQFAVKMMRGFIEIVTATKTAQTVPIEEVLDPRDFKPMPDFHQVKTFYIGHSEQSQQGQLVAISATGAEVILHFPGALFQQLIDRMIDEKKRQRG
jgi:hypothetical protein